MINGALIIYISNLKLVLCLTARSNHFLEWSKIRNYLIGLPLNITTLFNYFLLTKLQYKKKKNKKTWL